MPGFLYKGTTGVNKIPKNFLFPLTEELGSDEQNNSFDSESNCVKSNEYVCGKYTSKIEFTCKKCIEYNSK